MKEDLKVKILELLDEGKIKEAEDLSKNSSELTDFLKERIFIKNTLSLLKIRKAPERLNKKIMAKLFEEDEQTDENSLINSILNLFAFKRFSLSTVLSVLLIVIGIIFYSVKPIPKNISYFTYKAKSKIEFYFDKINSAKDLFVFMIDTKREEIIKDLIKKENKKNKEVKKWQIKTEKNHRELPYFYHSFLG